MRWLKTLFWMVVFVFAVLFSIQNREEVIIRFGLYPLQNSEWLEIPKAPLFLVIFGAVFVGVIIGGAGDLYRRFQLKKRLRQNDRTIQRLEKEIEALRAPVLDATSPME